jgi:hypothetical protein
MIHQLLSWEVELGANDICQRSCPAAAAEGSSAAQQTQGILEVSIIGILAGTDYSKIVDFFCFAPDGGDCTSSGISLW